ncbi:hypothetical protein H5410_034801 [Solanum commersonii]|uniref:NB-ARC domain-containing protein n=1 Tax=Solanum commersonii TaxID=4109 RepID=A0A9J5YUF3_SOLCO|nr:hypothetical protein H5410_034801 [Solanum commersonii]
MDVVEACGKGTLSSGEPSNKCSVTSIYDDDQVVGFEIDAQIIIKKLIRGTKERELISIYGMPGLGKTTLASKRYLIVLDDIWDVEAWEDLGICFPQGEYGSRVMVTTRIEEVAKHLQHHSDPYSLSFLTSKESWELLEKKVFRGESCPPDLLEAGLQVALHCKGLPLAVVLIAGIIAKMDREASLWLEIANDLTSLALGEQSMKVVQSSYDHLEDHLKTCLLYMALFPEDHKIPVDHLLKLWMAEEFVLNSETENMEEASRVCLSDLLNRSLVMVSGMRINRDVEYCSLHDVVREFCLRKLTEDKYMQLTVPYNPYQHLHSTESRLCIYIHDDLVKQLEHSDYQLDKIPMLDFKETNSLEFIAHPKVNTWNNQYLNPLDLVVKLRFVRALHMMDVALPNSWATAMQSLTQLRYIALYVKQFELEWISHLHNLQTLQLKLSSKRIGLRAAALREMTKLRHVNIDCFFVAWEYNDRGSFEECSTIILENMKTFHTCDISVDNARLWCAFPHLEELSLRVEYAPMRPLFPIPEVHTHIHSLSVVFSLAKFYNSVGWERYFVFPSNLRHLYLRGCFLTEEMVLNIARLKKLESLKLHMGVPFLTSKCYCWDVTNVEFPALKYLALHGVRIKEWKASEESFPVLEKLVIRGGFFKEIPPSFADIPTLKLIELFDCIYSVVVSALNIKRDIEENTGCDSLLFGRIIVVSTKPSITSIYDDDEVVGFEKHAEIMMKKLTQGTKERDVISIYGMPGLGKTTSAGKVYYNPSIVKAWCAVSQAYNRRTLLDEIFKQATNDDREIKEDDDVADLLRKSLISRRYLIVLDDIWDVEIWEYVSLKVNMEAE